MPGEGEDGWIKESLRAGRTIVVLGGAMRCREAKEVQGGAGRCRTISPTAPGFKVGMYGFVSKSFIP